MIDCANLETSHFFGDAIASQHRLRHRIFIERQGWKIPTYHGMEFDQYDSPATTYLIWRDKTGAARGVSRLYPTSLPYMLEEQWPDMVTNITLPSSDEVWEGTRFGIDNGLTLVERKRVLGELLCAYLEFSILHGIKQIIGIMPIIVWKAVFGRSGWPYEFLGEPHKINGEPVAAGRVNISQETLMRVRERTKINHPVLRTAQTILEQSMEKAA